jgi:hypothetical protein
MFSNPAATARPTLCGFLLAASALVAAHQPLLTDDAGTQGVAGNQIEFSWNEDQATQAATTTRSRSAPLVYTRGLAETFDAFIQANEGGSGNPSFGFKWRFYENTESKTSLAVKPEVRLSLNPAGEASSGQARTTVGVTAILSQEVPFGMVHANLLTNQDRFRDSRQFPELTRTRASIAPVWDVTDGWKLALDLAVEIAKTAATTIRAKIVHSGLVYSLNKDVDFAAGITHRTTNDMPRTTTHSGTLGITWRFK